MESPISELEALARLRHPAWVERTEALKALDALRPAGVEAAIIDVLQNDPVDHVRAHAALVLAACASESTAALELLLALLRDTRATPNVRGSAAEALHYYSDARVLPALIAALEDPAPEVRYSAAFSLSALTDPTAIPALERAAAIEQAEMPLNSVRDEMLEAIEHIRYNVAWRARQT